MKKIIFGTTNNRKLQDFAAIINQSGVQAELLSMADIGWDRGEIEENGLTIEENSLIKAYAILDYCKSRNLDYTIITDDGGLFVDALNGAPGIFTARFADDEISKDPTLPKHQAIFKMLRVMDGKKNRDAQYRCAVTIMNSDGFYSQIVESTNGYIDEKINEPIKKPWLYSLFVDKKTNKPFNYLTESELNHTYRYKALKKAVKILNSQGLENQAIVNEELKK